MDSPFAFMATVCGLSLGAGLSVVLAGLAARNFTVARVGIVWAGVSITLLVLWLALVAAILVMGGKP